MNKTYTALLLLAAGSYGQVINNGGGGGGGGTPFIPGGQNGGVYQNVGGNPQATATGGAGTLCFVETNGGIPTWGSCSGSAATAWSSLTNPSANEALNMGTNTTTFTLGTGTGTNSGFLFQDTTGNTGTGPVLQVATIGTSTMLPVQITAKGTANGINMTAAGLLQAIGTGGINATQIAGAALGTTTATSGNLLIGSGSQWVTEPLSQDCTLSSAGVITCLKTNGTLFTGAATMSLPVSVANGGTGVSTLPGTSGQCLINNSGAFGAVACGGLTLQTNGTNNSSQTTLNIQNGTAANGVNVMFSNPSAGNVKPAVLFTNSLSSSSILATDSSGNVSTPASPACSTYFSGCSGGGGITQLTSDVTAGPGSGSQAATIQPGVVTLAKMANLTANSIIGNNNGSPATPIALTETQVTAMLNPFSSSLKGVAPASGGGTTNFLRADGTWATPPGGGSGCNPSGGAGVVQASNGSGACQNTSITDNGTTVSTTEPISAGGTITAGGSGAGAFVFPQGTTQSAASGTFVLQAPPTITTPYELTSFTAPGTGLQFWTNTSGNMQASLVTSSAACSTYFTGCSGSTGVSSLNTLTGALTIAAGTNITVTPSGGNTLTIAAAGSGGSGLINTVATDFSMTVTSGTVLTMSAGTYGIGYAQYTTFGSTTYTLYQRTISTISSATQAVLTLSSALANSIAVGDTYYVSGATGSGCTGLNGLQTVVNIGGGGTLITINYNSMGCTYGASSATFGANPGASGTGYIYGDKLGNLTIMMPASAGILVSPSAGISIQSATPGFAAGSWPISQFTLNSTGNGNWATAVDKRVFAETTALIASTGMLLNEAGGVWTVGIDPSVVPELGAGNIWTGSSDCSGCVYAAPMPVLASAPVACVVGQYYFNTVTTTGNSCIAANTWGASLTESAAPIVLSNSSATSAVTLATSSIASGDYLITYGLDLHTPCTTGTGQLYLSIAYGSNAARTIKTGDWALTATQGASVPFSGVLPIHVVTGTAVTITPTLDATAPNAGACTTGTATWDGKIWMVGS